MPEITNDLMDMIIADESPSSVSDKIKDILFAKTAAKVDDLKNADYHILQKNKVSFFLRHPYLSE